MACELVARDPDRANLFARIPGAGEGPSMALIGHTDVVPASAEDCATRRSRATSTTTVSCGAAARRT